MRIYGNHDDSEEIEEKQGPIVTINICMINEWNDNE